MPLKEMSGMVMYLVLGSGFEGVLGTKILMAIYFGFDSFFTI